MNNFNDSSISCSTPIASSSRVRNIFATPKAEPKLNSDDEIRDFHYSMSAFELKGRMKFFKDLLECTELPNNGDNVKKAIQSMEVVLDVKNEFNVDEEPVQKKFRKSDQ
ncbi:unnamed protein product [Diamesa hyperborea]